MTYPEGVLRALFTPRWLGFLGLALLAVAVCVLLGLWQLGVARDEGLKDAVAAAGTSSPAALPAVLAPHAPFTPELSNRPVTARGTYAVERGLVVVDRRLGDRSGSWVVTPLVTSEGTIAVLRGFVPGSPTSPQAAPGGVVTVDGTLGPGESPRAGPALPGDQRRSIDLAELVNQWPGALYNAVIFASNEQVGGAAVGAETSLDRVPPPTLDAPLNLRNAAYAVQWWVFGLFAIWMWWKMFRAEQQGEPAVAAPREEVPA
ncbi:hypothetical protein BA895_08785 [Humibacillus sp. DSM 29435]|uniref:SURF1 family protein n=1 Tax=Humibacillus sp. DSM 29435 TaxID=1869167 RepID=UPI000872BA91|nr:SURF1 family protein [Humibacillus sp. DSM 29435]OFE14767.1 hypothetical protein BA895_08785 [Humibacillus sp. DSM 29435]